MGGGRGGDEALALRGGSHRSGLCEEFRLGDQAGGRGPDLVGHDEVVAGAGACGDVGSAEEKSQSLAKSKRGGGAALVTGVDGDDNVGAGNADGRDAAAFGDICGNPLPKLGGAHCEYESRNLEGGAGVLGGGGGISRSPQREVQSIVTTEALSSGAAPARALPGAQGEGVTCKLWREVPEAPQWRLPVDRGLPCAGVWAAGALRTSVPCCWGAAGDVVMNFRTASDRR